MWKQLLDWFKGQFTMAQEVSELRQEVERMRQRQDEQARALEHFLFAIERDRDHWRHEHEKLLLKLENELLKFERRLPPPHPPDEPR